MDRKTDDETEVENEEKQKDNLRLLLSIIEDEYQKLNKTFNDRLRSRWLRGNDKASLQIDQAMLHMFTILNKQMVKDMFAIDTFQRRLVNLEKITEELAEKTDADLSNIDTQLKTLNNTIKQPVFSHLNQYLTERMKGREKKSNTSDKERDRLYV